VFIESSVCAGCSAASIPDQRVMFPCCTCRRRYGFGQESPFGGAARSFPDLRAGRFWKGAIGFPNENATSLSLAITIAVVELRSELPASKKPPSMDPAASRQNRRRRALARRWRRPLDPWPRINFVHDGGRLREIAAHGERAIKQRGGVLLKIDHIRAEFFQAIGDIERLGPCVGAFFLKDLHFVRSWPVLNGLECHRRGGERIIERDQCPDVVQFDELIDLSAKSRLWPHWLDGRVDLPRFVSLSPANKRSLCRGAPRDRRQVVDGTIFNSRGVRVGMVLGPSIFDPRGQKLYDLKGTNVYKLSGELVGHLPLDVRSSERRLDKSADKLFRKNP
jgi:hypothetical protein